MLALHSPNRLADAEIDRRFGRQLDVAVDAELGLDPLVLDQTNRLDPPDLDAAKRHRPADAEPADGAEARQGDDVLLVDVGLAQPEGAGHHQRERQQHRQPDGEFVRAFHGRPSMNWRTIGSLGRLELGLGAHLADAPLVQHGDPVADAEGAPHVVRDHEPGHAEIAGPHHELVDDG